MNYLLDTHCLLWFLNGDKQLSLNARHLIEDIENECFFSISSCWEITIKKALGKLKLKSSLENLFQEISENNIQILPIQTPHLKELSKLKFHHRDPFDRLLIALAIHEKLAVIGKDEIFRMYPVKLVW